MKLRMVTLLGVRGRAVSMFCPADSIDEDFRVIEVEISDPIDPPDDYLVAKANIENGKLNIKQ